MRTLPLIGLVIIAAGITVLVLADVMMGMDGLRGDQIVSIIAALALLIVLGGGTLRSYQEQSGTAVKHAAIWLAIIAVITLVYNYRDVLGINID